MERKILKLDKKQLMLIMGVGNAGLRKIEERDQLKERLQRIGYKLLQKGKDGRKIIYEIVQEDVTKEIFSNICKHVFNTNKPEEFGKFFIHRTESARHQIPKTNKEIGEMVEVSARTIGTWNRTLIDKNIICKDGYYYFAIDWSEGEFTNRQTTQEEYKSYWNNKREEAIYNEIEYRFNKEEINFREAIRIVKDIGQIQAAIEGKYLYRISKYTLDSENQLYIDTYELIKKGFKEKFTSFNFDIIDQFHHEKIKENSKSKEEIGL